MEYGLALIVFVFGLIVGSFLNVVASRYNTGVSFLKGHSMCFSCGKKLSWFELIPLISFTIQNGKCRTCKSKISWQYPIVELISGFVFLIIFMRFGVGDIPLFLYTAILAGLLIVISVYDVMHKIIPDGLVYLLVAIFAIYSFKLGNFPGIINFIILLHLCCFFFP